MVMSGGRGRQMVIFRWILSIQTLNVFVLGVKGTGSCVGNLGLAVNLSWSNTSLGNLSMCKICVSLKANNLLSLNSRNLFLGNMPFTARYKISSGLPRVSAKYLGGKLRCDPAYPVCHKYFLSLYFSPVNLMFFTLYTTMLSP